MPPATDPFASLEHQYDVGKLIWASSKRGSLKQSPPLQLRQDRNDAIIRVQKISSGLQENTGIQAGYQLLKLQGKNVTDYQGGFEEIQRTLKESLVIDVVVLRCEVTESSSPASSVPKMSKTKLNDPGEDGWVKISPIPNKCKQSTTTPKEEKKTRDDPLAALQKRYRNEDLLWASYQRHSARLPVPFQLTRDDQDVIRIGQIQPKFQELTGVRSGQRLVWLEERDIESYRDLDEIQATIQETLEIDLVVIRSEAGSDSSSSTTKSRSKKHKKKRKKKRSKVPAKLSSTDNQSPFEPSTVEETSIITEASTIDLGSQPTSDPSLSSSVGEETTTTTDQPTNKYKGNWLKSKLSFRPGRKKSHLSAA